MYYVYTMSVNGIVFYVGMSKQPDSRYINHYTDSMSGIHKITRYLLLNGILCDMQVIHQYKTKDKCIVAEREYINQYGKLYFLVNSTNCEYWRHLITNDEIRRLPFILIHKLEPKIKDIKQQMNRLNELWKTI